MLAIERLETKKIVREIKIKELSKQTMKMYAHRITEFKNWIIKTLMKIKETKIVKSTNRKIEEILRNISKFGIISILVALTMMEKFVDFILEQRTAGEKVDIQEEKFEFIEIILDESKPEVENQEITETEIESSSEVAIVESCHLFNQAKNSHHEKSEIKEYICYEADSEDGEYDSDDEYVSEDEEDEEDEKSKFPNLENNFPSQEEHIYQEEEENHENNNNDLESSDCSDSDSDYSDSDSEYEYVPTEKEKQLEKEAAEAAKKEEIEIDPEEIEEEKKMQRLMNLEKEIKNRLSKINELWKKKLNENEKITKRDQDMYDALNSALEKIQKKQFHLIPTEMTLFDEREEVVYGLLKHAPHPKPSLKIIKNHFYYLCKKERIEKKQKKEELEEEGSFEKDNEIDQEIKEKESDEFDFDDSDDDEFSDDSDYDSNDDEEINQENDEFNSDNSDAKFADDSNCDSSDDNQDVNQQEIEENDEFDSDDSEYDLSDDEEEREENHILENKEVSYHLDTDNNGKEIEFESDDSNDLNPKEENIESNKEIVQVEEKEDRKKIQESNENKQNKKENG